MKHDLVLNRSTDYLLPIAKSCQFIQLRLQDPDLSNTTDTAP